MSSTPLVTRTLVADGITPVRAYAALRAADPGSASFLLESVVGGERWGRYSVLGTRPRHEAILTAAGWTAPDGMLAGQPDPLRAAAAEKFARAQVGYFAWDLVHSIERVPAWPAFDGPLARFVGGATVVVFDGLAQTVTVAGDDGEVARVLGVLESAGATPLRSLPVPDRARLPPGVEVSMSDGDYETIVRRAQEYIAAGDAFQVVLARTFSARAEGTDPFDAYRAMRALNPSPYMYFLDLPPGPGEASRTCIAGASPETLVRLEGGVMTVRPIAGTRPRGASEDEDAALAKELLADAKELAEHVMLIDLGRNDVGRVARVGTVDLVRRMDIERYSHVMHIVSEVRGRVPADVGPLEVLRAAFPAGTLSGAPKLRAMQIVRELETAPRGVYGGAIGYVTPEGDLDFAIAIRTAVWKDGVFRVTAGAGIVEASVPRTEAEETWNKARGVLCAIEAAG